MISRRIYQVLAAALLSLYAAAELSGWELPINAVRGTVPVSARNAGGYRSFHFWSGGK